LAYSIHFAVSSAVALPFDGELWNPSHNPNAGRRGAFLGARPGPLIPIARPLLRLISGDIGVGPVPTPQIGRFSAASSQR
jgi:hypothetical protein